MGPILTDDPGHFYIGANSSSALFKNRDLSRSLNRAAHIFWGRPTQELDIADETVFWTYRPEPLHGLRVIMGQALEDNPNAADQEAFWRTVMGPDLEVWPMPGHHNRLLRDPFAAPFAARLTAWLDEHFPYKDRDGTPQKNPATAGDFPIADPEEAH